jgi:hypothetical protein
MASEIRDATLEQMDLLLANWRNEMDSADLYNFLAGREQDDQRASLLREMADSEIRHAVVMENGLRERGIKLPRHRASFRTRVLKALARLVVLASSTPSCMVRR